METNQSEPKSTMVLIVPKKSCRWGHKYSVWTPITVKTTKGHEYDRQERVCVKCGYTQRKDIDDY